MHTQSPAHVKGTQTGTRRDAHWASCGSLLSADSPGLDGWHRLLGTQSFAGHLRSDDTHKSRCASSRWFIVGSSEKEKACEPLWWRGERARKVQRTASLAQDWVSVFFLPVAVCLVVPGSLCCVLPFLRGFQEFPLCREMRSRCDGLALPVHQPAGFPPRCWGLPAQMDLSSLWPWWPRLVLTIGACLVHDGLRLRSSGMSVGVMSFTGAGHGWWLLSGARCGRPSCGEGESQQP